MAAGTIVMQNIRQDDGGNIAVQITGVGTAVTIDCGGIVLRLQAKHARRREPRSDLDLLRPETRLLDLLGREAEIASLQVWLDDPRPVLVRGITGRAGSGKTRLAIELCELAASAGWQAGFLDVDDLQAFVEAQYAAEWPRNQPVLVVIDHAAHHVRALNDWLQSLSWRADPARPRLRLLLIERHASTNGGWWDELLRLDGGDDDSLYGLLDPPEPLPLPPIGGVEQRRALLAGAMAAWCRRNGEAVLTLPAAGADPRLDRRLADPLLAAEPLHLMMAGLVAARHGLTTPSSLGRLDLALELACRERDRLRKLAGDRGIDDELLLHLVACITLCRGLDRAGIVALIDEECAALLHERGVGRGTVLQAVEAALPAQAPAQGDEGTPYFSGIQPDIVGETFCLLVLAANPDLDQEALIDRCRERAPARTAQHLVLTIQDFARPALEPKAGPLSSRRAEARLLPHWLGEANPALAWLDHLIAGTDNPDRSPLLHEQAIPTHRRIIEVLRPLADGAADDKPRAILAAGLNNLANRLSDLGRYEPALQAAEEAARLYRDLAADRPDAFRPSLAISLNSLASSLSDLGRREEALQAAEEAARLHRELAAEWPDTFRPDLAMSLNNLANSLSDLGRREAALQVAEEAARLYRELAAERPDAFRPDLAKSLNNLANRLRALGRREAALQTAEEAVRIRRELAEAQPDAFRPDLAMSLNNLASSLGALGRPEPALQAAEEAVWIYRELVVARPDAFRPDLAGSLNNLANRLSDLGRHEAALQATEEAARLYRGLAAAWPDAFLPDLAMSLNNLANRLSDLGQREAALQAIEEAVRIRRELAAELPDAFLPDLVMSLNNLAGSLSDLDREEAALQVAEEAVQLCRELAAAQPDAFQHDLATSLAMLANCLDSVAQPAAALTANREAIEKLREPFLASPPAFSPWMLPMLHQYLERCTAQQVEADEALLEPILPALMAIMQQEQEEQA
jgi:tetratricopeptide (TPR) repeat protein